MISRRFFIGSLIAAPAIVRFPSLMKLPHYSISDYAEQAFDFRSPMWQLWKFNHETRAWTVLVKEGPPYDL